MKPALLPFVIALAAAAQTSAAVPRFAPMQHGDPADHGAALDLRSAAFGQVATQLQLTVRTQRPRSPGDDLCLTLLRPRPVGRLCITDGARHRPILRYRHAWKHLPRYGRFTGVRGAEVERHGRVLSALIYPHALRLHRGPVRWFVTSRDDRLPDAGSFKARVGVYGAPRCFGAAARAGHVACVNRALRRLVTPSPSAAALMPDYPCRPQRHAHRYAPAQPCVFGDTYDPAPPRLALIGDSHSAHLRASAEVAAQALGWRAVSLTHPGCAFSTEVYPAPAPIPQRCRRHSREALRWLRGHPSVRAVITSASAGRGFSEGGFRAMWGRVPRTVRRIYVVRDVPRVSYTTAGCVAAVRRRHAVSTGACAVPRSGAFPADPAAGAARHAGGRVRLIDLTRHFCSRAHCFPVVGGAYVYHDSNHLNRVFAATLGPYLLRAMRPLPR